MAETIDLFAAKEVGATLPWAVLAIKAGMLSGAGHWTSNTKRSSTK
jgi:hypothetical protein